MLISLFGKVNKDTKLLYKHSDSVVIGSRTKKEYAFQIGNFLNMLYENIEHESSTMTNKVVLHNLLVELSILKIENCLYDELIGIVSNFPIKDKEKAYNSIDRCVHIISIIYSDYYDSI